MADGPLTVFNMSADCFGDFPTTFLKNSEGFTHADRYAKYNPVHEKWDTHVEYMMHVHRSFFDA